MYFNPAYLVKILQNFSSGLKNFGIADDDTYIKIINFLIEAEVQVTHNEIEVNSNNKIIIARLAAEMGCNVQDICSYIHWHDFELFSSIVLKLNGYAVHNNYRMRKPTREIDIVGIKSGNALLIDCKHWKKGFNPSLTRVVDKQKNRSFQFMDQKYVHVKNSFPVIITFLPTKFSYLNRVPIVPITMFNSFLVDFDDCDPNLLKL